MSTAAPSSDPDRPIQPGAKKNSHRWTRIAAWIASGLLALVLVAIATIAIVLHSAWFHNYVLRTAQAKASEQLGVQVQLQNFAIHLSNLSLDLYGVTVQGAEPYPNPPLLQVEHIEVGVRVVSILHRKWYLDSVRVDRPVARVFTDARGVSNIPKMKSTGSSSNTSIFELGIRNAVLNRGEVEYNDKKSVIEADLHDVDFRSLFDARLEKYSGALRYRDGDLRAGSFHPILHTLDIQFDATPTTLHLTNAKLTSGPSQITLTATLEDYSHPKIQGDYDATLDGSELRRFFNNPSVPSGEIRASGSVQYQSSPNHPILDALVLEGDLSSPQLDVHTPKVRVRISSIAAHYSLANGNATVQNLRAHLLGGKLTGTLNMRNMSGDSQSKLHASLRGISLTALKQLAPASAMTRDLALRGVLNANADAAWGKTINNLVARTDATLHANVSGSSATDAALGPVPAAIPIEGVIHGTYSAAKRQIALAPSYLQMPQTTLRMHGTLSQQSSLAVQFESSDLRELETIADLVRSSAPGPTSSRPMPLGLAGSASFEGILRGSTVAPHLSGQIVASNLHVKGTAWRVLRTNVDLSPSFASLQNADLEPASHGRITFNFSAELVRWSFTDINPVQLELHASQMNVADLGKLLGSQLPVTGTLAANVRIHGTELNPLGQGTVSLTHAQVYDEPIQLGNLTFAGTDNQVRGNLSVQLPAGTLHSVVTIQPKEKSYVAQLTGIGIHLDQLRTLRIRNVDATGLVNLNASGHGTFQNPQFDATLKIPKLAIQKQEITNLVLHTNVANHVATATMDSHAINTSARAQAKVNLSGDYFAEATLDTQKIPLQPLLAIYVPSQADDLSGETELHASLRGPLKNKNLLEVHITIPTLKLGYSNTVQLAAVSPIHLDYRNGILALQRTAIRGTDTDLQLQGSIPTINHGPISLLLLGAVNLHLMHLFNPDIRSSGEVRFNIDTYGARANPNMEGQVEVVNANFAGGDLPIGLQRGNGTMTLTKDRLSINQFSATVGGGTLTAQGGVVYQPSIQFDLGATAGGVRMLYPQGVRESVDADLRLAGTTDNALLGGKVRIADLSFTPDFDLTSFVGQFSGGVSLPPSQGFSQNLNLNLAVSSANDLNLVSRTLSLDGTANLQVRGTAAQPVILGRINLNNGDVIFNGNRFILNGGTVEFVNPSQTQPVVNLALTTTIQQYNINLRFNGPVDQLRTNYTSDPSLPTADIFNLLAFGQTTEANTANPAVPGNQAAESLVASQVSSQITSRISKVAGISQLSINPVLAGGSSQGPAGATVTIQQRVTGNLFVTFSSNVTSTQNQVIMGQYQLSPRVAVTGTRDQNGGFAVDMNFKKTW